MPASWTTPRTWATGQVVAASDLNTDVRDNLLYLYEATRALSVAVTGGTTTVNAGSEIALAYTTVFYDTAGFVGTDTTVLTVPVDGIYLVTCSAQIAGPFGGEAVASSLIYGSGSLLDQQDWIAGTPNYTHATLVQLTAGTAVQARFRHAATSAYTVYSPDIRIHCISRS